MLVLIQQQEITLDAIQQACETLDVAQEEAMEVIEKLSDTFTAVTDYKSRDELGEEIEKMETEYTEVQNWVQEVYDELSKSNAYRKFERTLGETQPSYLQESEATHIQASQPLWHSTVW